MAYPTVIKKASIRRPFYFMKESGKSGWSALPFPPVAIGAEIPPIRMIGFEDGLSQFFGDIRAPVSYTHLDVYKRQMLIRSSASRQSFRLSLSRDTSGLARRVMNGE